jgi:hypothetical protein
VLDISRNSENPEGPVGPRTSMGFTNKEADCWETIQFIKPQKKNSESTTALVTIADYQILDDVRVYLDRSRFGCVVASPIGSVIIVIPTIQGFITNTFIAFF